MRTSIARLTAGTLVALVACTGTPSSTSPSDGTSGSTTGPTSGTTRLANGQPLPADCPTGTAARDETVAFVADGNAWLLDPANGDISCLFPAPSPGPFTWNPRGDRALLRDLEIQSIHGELLRAASPPATAVAAWGHPIGKAVVYISPSGTRLRKVYPGTQRRDDITPVAHVHYLNVIYHPSGLALAFVIDTGDGEEIWLSSNLGEDPVRLVFAVGGTRFGALDFTADGTTLLYAAVHGDDAPLLHAIDLTNPTINQGLWHGDPGDRISSIATQPDRDGELIALTVGATCEDSRAMMFRAGEQPQPLADAPSRVVGWLDRETVLVATDGCAGPSNLVAIDSAKSATVPLVSGIEIASARTPLLGFVPQLPAGIEEAVGSGVG
jgi:outer membrane protein assembly factor BamB